MELNSSDLQHEPWPSAIASFFKYIAGQSQIPATGPSSISSSAYTVLAVAHAEQWNAARFSAWLVRASVPSDVAVQADQAWAEHTLRWAAATAGSSTVLQVSQVQPVRQHVLASSEAEPTGPLLSVQLQGFHGVCGGTHGLACLPACCYHLLLTHTTSATTAAAATATTTTAGSTIHCQALASYTSGSCTSSQRRRHRRPSASSSVVVSGARHHHQCMQASSEFRVRISCMCVCVNECACCGWETCAEERVHGPSYVPKHALRRA